MDETRRVRRTGKKTVQTRMPIVDCRPTWIYMLEYVPVVYEPVEMVPLCQGDSSSWCIVMLNDRRKIVCVVKYPLEHGSLRLFHTETTVFIPDNEFNCNSLNRTMTAGGWRWYSTVGDGCWQLKRWRTWAFKTGEEGGTGLLCACGDLHFGWATAITTNTHKKRTHTLNAPHNNSFSPNWNIICQ
jgi:hypothetical protein